MIFSGSSHLKLAKEIASHLSEELGKIECSQFPDLETNVRILERVVDKEIFLVQSLGKDPNKFLMELCVAADALQRASCKRITAVVPYMGYTRQDRYIEGEPITAKLIAKLLEASGIERLITMDLHTEQLEGFFEIPICHISARKLFMKEIEKLPLSRPIVVAPDAGGAKLAARYASDLSCEMAIVQKKRGQKTGELMGEVKNKEVLIVDDILSTGETLEQSVDLCRRKGAKTIYAFVSHGPLAEHSATPDLDGLFVTDSVAKTEGKWKVVPSASLFANAINQYQSNIM